MILPTSTINPFSQIPFEFADHATEEQQAEIDGVRIKSVKKKEVISSPESETPVKSTRGRKSLKTYDLDADLVDIPEDELLFQKQYYSMGEVATMFRVNHSLLRFWEAEFDIIQPRKNRKGDRHFRPVDIKNLQLIYDLLRRRKLTIEGAKNFIKQQKGALHRFELIQSLQKIRSFLLDLRASL
ncbi:MAG TPA: MerR family transcriptional regulator [Flavitalea sp.]|nr:MerR family transcriptional regulator [Flavitalea sp.]